ncbi:ubiquitin-conjugating enzyme [Phlyctema vagabunda]|uniref:Ubiquitin-conjugating enzyme n=1 Tax=Phlyctema vagabunda TaxID=108571 RepID=A0ABR4PNC6_9HELO
MSSASKSSSSSRSPTKRLLSELNSNNSTALPPGILSLAPLSASNLHTWRSIISGRELPAATGYTRGRWLLSITVPTTYPLAAPQITFVTKMCHPNVHWDTGEVCLDLLKERWTPVLTLRMCVEAVLRLLAEPGPESPLNVEMGALLRQGDTVGARALTGFFSDEERFEGAIESGFGA